MKKILLLLTILSAYELAYTQDIIDPYLDFLKLQPKFSNAEYLIHSNDGVLIKNKIVYLVLDSLGETVKNTTLPSVLKESDQYRFAIIVLADLSDSTKYKFKMNGKKYNPDNNFSIFNTSVEKKEKKKTAEALDKMDEKFQKMAMYVSDTSEVFSEEVFFEVIKGDSIIFKWSTELTKTKNYHVAIRGGYFFSTLNNPTNVTKIASAKNSTDSTLVGDFVDNQRMVTVMAVFYPWVRLGDYQWKRLKWYEYWSIGFGIGVDRDLFQDLFLGLNLEFAKGGYFSGGVHYGKHNVLAAQKDFDYGTDVWNQAFDNSMMREQWDLGYYLGVTIDLNVIGELISLRDKPNGSDDK